MRIIQVVNVRWYNATAWYGVMLARCLKEAGHEVLVVGLPSSPPLKRAEELGLNVAALPLNGVSPRGILRAWQGIVRIAEEFRPDVVNCHRGEAFVFWALLKRRFGFALIRTRGDRRLPKGGFANRWLHERAADAVIATNSLMFRHFKENFRIAQDSLRTILGGVDTERFHPDDAARKETRDFYGFTEKDIVLGLLGRMDSVKGIRETVAALARVRELEPKAKNFRFLVIGFDSEFKTADVEGWAREAGLEGFVRVTGKVAHPERVLCGLDAGILPSLGSEAIARAALEMMATGVPLVSSTTGVMPDLLPADCVFAPGDIEGMARMLLRLLDPEFRESHGRRCLARVLHGGLTLADFLAVTLSVYERALFKKGKG